MARDAIPAIPAVPTSIKDKQLRNHLQAIRDTLQTRAGQTKNRLDYSPTVRELEEAGLITVGGGGFSGNENLGPIYPGTPPAGGNYPTIPDAPTGVTVLATPWFHHITWDLPAEPSHYITSHGEVWTSETNDRTTAWLVGISSIAMSTPVEPLAHRFYWVRYISHNNVEGPWSNDIYDGVEGISPPDPETLLEILAGAITESELYSILNDRLDGYGAGIVRSDNSWAVKILKNVNGEDVAAGFGLIIDGDENYNPLLGHSQFGVSASTFWVGAPGATKFGLTVDGTVDPPRVAMHGASIVSATITGAAIGTAAIDSAHIGAGVITELHVEQGAITNLKIGDEIRSYTFDPQNGVGWRILKSGLIQANEIEIRDNDGTVILAAGRLGASYHERIENSSQLFADISDIPDHLEFAALLSMPSGGYGNLKLTFLPQPDGVAYVEGNRFFLPDGTRYDVEAGTYIELFQRPDTTYKAAFIVYFATNLFTKFSGWTASSYYNQHMCLCTFDDTSQRWSAWDTASLHYDFTPDSTNCIIATTSRKDPQGSDATFNSLIGVNAALPDDNATSTGHINLIIDGDFHGTANALTGQGIAPATAAAAIYKKQPYWICNGRADTAATWRVEDSYGDCVHIATDNRTGDALEGSRIHTAQPISVTYGVNYYCTMQFGKGGSITSTHSSYTNPAIKMYVYWYDLNDVQIGYSSPINFKYTTSGANPFLHTGVVTPVVGAYTAKVQLVADPVGGVWTRFGFAGMSLMPQAIGTKEAATYIKNAAIDTLQLAGNSVMVADVNTQLGVKNLLYGTSVHSSCIDNSVALAELTSTSSLLVRYEGHFKYENYHESPYITLHLDYQINGGAWVEFWEVNPRISYVRTSSQAGNNEPVYTYHGSGFKTFTGMVLPGGFVGSRVFKIRCRAWYRNNLTQAWSGDFFTVEEQVLMITAAQR
jgi:hypothetical protein